MESFVYRNGIGTFSDNMDVIVREFNSAGDILILPLFEGVDKAPNNALAGLSRTQRSLVNEALASESFTGKSGKRLSVWTAGCQIILVGMGTNPSDKSCRDEGAKTLATLSKDYGTNLTVRFTTGWSTSKMSLFAEGMILRDYVFDKYQQKKEDGNQGDWNMTCQASARHQSELSSAVAKSSAIATGVHVARELGNEPANVMYPDEYARRAIEWANGKANVEVEVWDYERLQKEGMHGVIAVGKGSERKPCMVFFRLNPNVQKDEQVPCIVGKGITFDTGGISIKPSAGMEDMKFDMHGSATVFGLFVALYASGHKGRVNGITCMAENMLSAGAYRPGDIIDTYSGKTIEVLNTDAEGRNVLSDGLWKASELNPSYIVDLATLTGACVVALGHEASGLWSNRYSLSQRIHKAGNAEDEIAWPMPLLPAFEKEMTGSKVADVQNLGKGRWGGACTAAGFLKQFVQERDGEQIPWAHLDIAGTAWGASTNAMVANGATGIHVRTLHRLITE
jgi:leucyl aminopeptidase